MTPELETIAHIAVIIASTPPIVVMGGKIAGFVGRIRITLEPPE